MEQAVAVGHELHESAEILDCHHASGVGLALFGQLYDAVDHLQSLVDGVFVGGSHFDVATFGDFVDGDCGARFLLDALDHFSARADDGTDKLFGNEHGDDAGHVGLVVLAGCGDGLLDFVEDVEATLLGLVEGAFENLVAEAVALDVHLGSGDALAGTGDFEVHVAQVVFVAEDVGEDGVFVGAVVRDEAHGDAADGAFHLHAGVHQGECACADGGHRRRAVALEDVAHHAAYVGEIIGEHALEGAVGEVAVADFAAAYAALCLGFAGGEGREIIVEQEALATLIEHVVENLLVEFGAEGYG